MDEQRINENRTKQVQFYGAPLAEVVRMITQALGLNQTRIAETIGLSGPMLSQLVGGGRVKIGSPLVAARLSQLRQLADAVVAGSVGVGDVPVEVERIRRLETADMASQTVPVSHPEPAAMDDREIVGRVQDLFRSVAGAHEWLAAADLLQPRHPEIAAVMRTYGAARTDEAVTHFSRLTR